MTATVVSQGAELSAHDVVVYRGKRRILDDVSLTIAPGQLVAVVGPSGGGKSTLLESLAGMRPLASGSVRLDDLDVHTDLDRVRSQVGFVPQDDIIHRELPLRSTLRHAARLRLATGVDHDEVVGAVLADLDLVDQASLPVGSLSGGQRKRASVAVELLARPRLLLLDEPTAGLDPTTAAALIRTLRRLADSGCTVVLTTHNTQDLSDADAVAVIENGRIVHWGDRVGALVHLGAAAVDLSETTPALVRPTDWTPAPHLERSSGTAMDQWRVLTRRNAELLARNRLTVAIMLGAPALVIAMFAVLFTPGTFDPAADPSNQPTMVVYWLAFAGFFFGLTYGLLQVVTEVAIARRERFAGVRIGPYVAAKIAVLVPILLAVDIVMLSVLRVLDRLPAVGAVTFTTLAMMILLDAVAAVLLGLLISTLVADASHATIALPMVCFPAVLFAGAIQPVGDMTTAGQAISVITPARWAFEAIGDILGVGDTHAAATITPLNGSVVAGSFALCVFAVTFALATGAALRRRLA